MSERARDFLVGLTSLVAVVVLATLLMLFGELEGILHPRYQIQISTNNAGGLRPGSSVQRNGVPIGHVESVEVQDNIEYPVRVTAVIDATERIPDNAQAYAASSLIGGSASLNFEVPNGETPSSTFLATDGSSHIMGPLLYKLYEDINAALDERMRPILSALTEFEELAQTYTEVGGNLNELLRPLSDEEIAGGAPPNLASAAVHINSVLEDVQDALALARDWLADEQLRADAREAVSRANTLIDRATEAVDQYASLAESIQGNADVVVAKVTEVSDDISITLEEIQRLTTMATSGEGTVAQLLNNPDLYRSLNDAAIRLERALTQAQLFIEKVKAEGLPVDFLGGGP